MKLYLRRSIIISDIGNYGLMFTIWVPPCKGVGGHAGLFSNAEEVYRIMQIYLQKGSANGLEFFSPKTFDDFNHCYYCNTGNRRGIGLINLSWREKVLPAVVFRRSALVIWVLRELTHGRIPIKN